MAQKYFSPGPNPQEMQKNISATRSNKQKQAHDVRCTWNVKNNQYICTLYTILLGWESTVQ